MIFKKVFLRTFLMIALTGASLWAMEEELATGNRAIYPVREPADPRNGCETVEMDCSMPTGRFFKVGGELVPEYVVIQWTSIQRKCVFEQETSANSHYSSSAPPPSTTLPAFDAVKPEEPFVEENPMLMSYYPGMSHPLSSQLERLTTAGVSVS